MKSFVAKESKRLITVSSLKKKLILINPPMSLHERYGSLKSAANLLPNLGLCYLAAVAIRQGWEVKIIDCPALGIVPYDLVRTVQKEIPDIIGITATTLTILSAHSLMRKVKEILPDVLTLIGGSHISALPESFQEFGSFDIAVIGEGELTLKDILCYAEGRKDIGQIDGIAYRDGKTIHFTRPRLPIMDIDTLPFPSWDLLPSLARYYRPSLQCIKRLPATILITSRGCPYKCAFCDHSVFGYRIRYHGTKYIIDMIKHLQSKYKIREFSFHDECLFTERNRIVDLVACIIKEGLKITWTVQARVDQIDAKLLAIIKKAGCWQIQLGIESGSEKVLKNLNKNISKEQIAEACRLIKDAGISLKGFFMMGSPGEDKATIKETSDFALALPLDDFQCTFFTPYPGCQLYRELDKWGTMIESDFSKMNQFGVVFVPFALDKATLEKEFKKGYRKFYIRPRILLNYLARMREPSLWNLYVKVAAKLVFLFELMGIISYNKFMRAEKN